MLDINLLSNYLLYWVIFGLVHTLLATDAIKFRLIDNFISPSHYRLIYNGIAIISMLTMLVLTPEIMFVIFTFLEADLVTQLISLAVIVTGGIILLLGILAWDLSGFLGLKTEQTGLQQGGIYAFARHPVYTGTIIFLLGLVIADFSEVPIAWFLGLTLYCYVGSIHEESKLQEVFSEYAEYSKKVGRFFPITISHWKYVLA